MEATAVLEETVALEELAVAVGLGLTIAPERLEQVAMGAAVAPAVRLAPAPVVPAGPPWGFSTLNLW